MPNTLQVYDGELRFEEGDHKYTWNGTPVPGVTSILKQLNKPALVQWSSNTCGDHVFNNYRVGMSLNDMELLVREAKVAHNKVRNTAATIGTKVHSYVEAVMKGKERPRLDDQAALSSVEAFEDWFKRQEFKAISSEQMIFSKKYWYAGTADIIGMINGQLTIADIKTSSGIFDDMFMQLGGYTYALEEMEPSYKVAQWIIIRLDKKTGKFETGRVARNSLYVDAFLRCRELHKCMTLIEELRHEHLEKSKSPRLSLVKGKRPTSKAASSERAAG